MNEYICADAMKEMPELADDSIDLIFTSLPDLDQTPYGEKKEVNRYQAWQSRVMTEFCRLIKDDGFIVICQTDRKVNGEVLANHITYVNKLVFYGFKFKDHKIIVRNSVGMKDMFYFTFQHMCAFTKKGTMKRKGEWLKDILVYPVKKINNQTIWNREFVRMVIEHLSDEGDMVLDPFAGHGIVPYISKEMARNFKAYEILPLRYNENFKLFEDDNQWIG